MYCMYVYALYVHVCMCMYACACVCMHGSVCMYIHICVCIAFICIYACTACTAIICMYFSNAILDIHVYTFTYMHVLHVCTYMQPMHSISKYVHVYTCTYSVHFYIHGSYVLQHGTLTVAGVQVRHGVGPLQLHSFAAALRHSGYQNRCQHLAG
jgi:hypothetical protein